MSWPRYTSWHNHNIMVSMCVEFAIVVGPLASTEPGYVLSLDTLLLTYCIQSCSDWAHPTLAIREQGYAWAVPHVLQNWEVWPSRCTSLPGWDNLTTPHRFPYVRLSFWDYRPRPPVPQGKEKALDLAKNTIFISVASTAWSHHTFLKAPPTHTHTHLDCFLRKGNLILFLHTNLNFKAIFSKT